MNFKIVTTVICFCCFSSISAAELIDSVVLTNEARRFVGISLNSGKILKTNDFIKKADTEVDFSSLSVKYGYRFPRHSRFDRLFGMPYLGLGVNVALLGEHDRLGVPFTVFLFQGAKLFGITERLWVNYEWNLGLSFNWKCYDPFVNPDNIAIGSPANVYVGFMPHLHWVASENFDLKLGFGMEHFSNGAMRYPNRGLNLWAPFVEANYVFGKAKSLKQPLNLHPKTERRLRVDYDLIFTLSSRQVEFSTKGTQLPSSYVDHDFRVLGLSFAPLIVPNERIKYGISIDGVYDESSCATATREYNPADGGYHDRVVLGRFADRWSLGTSIKGKIAMPYYSIFANFGYNWFSGNDKDHRIYQIIGIELPFTPQLFGTFGIRSTHFSKASFFYWSLGYCFGGK
ncbi:MAG: hypothetical protein LBR81_10220 [Prevotellaceae bacterium]|jgi:hypothetical protein|nr:hypothetical protein [Prevotellaceae bacterium]